MRSQACESKPRDALTVTLSVWKALFLREAVQRLFARRAAWAWLFLEPVVHVGYLVVIFSVVRVQVIAGIDTAVWLMAGLVAFFMFRRTGLQTMNAVGANEALFTYRQVQPVDAVLTRAGLEGFLMLLVALVLLGGAGLVGYMVFPEDPLGMLEALFGLWLVGLGFGLMSSVAAELVPELGKLIGLCMTPLFFVSGCIFHIGLAPPPYRGWLMLNPVAQGVEAARYSFSHLYQAVPELSVGYLYGFALVTVFFGLALHARFAAALTTK